VNDDELARTIAKLHADYADQLPATVVQMEDLWRRLVAAEIPLSRLEELVRRAHSIAGSGATFGVPEAGRAAQDFEWFLEQLLKGGRPPGPAEQKTAAVLLAALAQAAVQR
jgi:HPt (histidine-containing phosphotransfer) domain-containing protein